MRLEDSNSLTPSGASQRGLAVWLSVLFAVGAMHLLAFSTNAVMADTINVPEDYPGVIEAVDAAVNGDLILVHTGNYPGPINFQGKAITVRNDSPSVSKVTLGGIGTVVIFENGEGPDSVLDGFSIRDSTASEYNNELVGGAIRIVDSSPTVIGCFMFNNGADDKGGAIYCENSEARLIGNAFFASRSRDGLGGGIYVGDFSDVTLENCVFLNCLADYGAGLYVDSGSNINVKNCTISVNFADFRGGGIVVGNDASATVVNSIVYDNTDNVGNGEDTQIYLEGIGATASVNYTCINDGWTPGGTGNISDDPQFLGFDLNYGSPCIDAGDNTAVASDLTLDYGLDPRKVDDAGVDDSGNGSSPIVDMGAFEFQSTTGCLRLNVTPLRAGSNTTFTVEWGIPGETVAIVWGKGGGPKTIIDLNGFCATFGFDLPLSKANQRTVAAGKFDNDGIYTIQKLIPQFVQGQTFMFQAAERNTCPEECVSNVETEIVQ